MPLTPTQTEFLEQFLKVKKKRLFRSTLVYPTEYQKIEAEVISAIEGLKDVPNSAAQIGTYEQQVKVIQEDVKKLDESTAKEGFKTAIAKLEELKKLTVEYRENIRKYTESQEELKPKWEQRYREFENVIKEIEALPNCSKHPKAVELREVLQSSFLQSGAGQYEKAIGIISNGDEVKGLQAVKEEIRQYTELKNSTVSSIEDLRKHARHEAIPEELKGLDEEVKKADNKAGTGAYLAAMEFLRAVPPLHAAALEILKDCESYHKKRTVIAKAIALLKKHQARGEMGTEFGEVDAKLTAADEHAKPDKRTYGQGRTALDAAESKRKEVWDLAEKVGMFRSAGSGLRQKHEVLKTHPGKDAITTELSQAGTKLDTFDTKVNERKWSDAGNLYGQIETLLKTGTSKAAQPGMFLARYNNTLLLHKKLQAHPYKDAISSEISALKTNIIDRAKSQYDTGSFVASMNLLLTARAAYDTAKQKADRDGNDSKYTPKRESVSRLLEGLETHVQTTFISKEIASIKAKLAEAKKYADAYQYPAGIAVLDTAENECKAAKKLADDEKAYLELNQSTKGLVDNAESNVQPAIDATEKLLVELKKHPQKDSITEESGKIGEKIESAKLLAV